MKSSDGNNFEISPDTIKSTIEANKFCNLLLDRNMHRVIIDFEDHMDNIQGDLINTAVNNAIEDLIKKK